MADIHIKRSHSFSREDIKARVSKALDKMSSGYGVKSEWKGQDQVAISATGVKGTIDIREKDIEVKIELNFLMRAMKGKIEEGINKAFDKELAAPQS